VCGGGRSGSGVAGWTDFHWKKWKNRYVKSNPLFKQDRCQSGAKRMPKRCQTAVNGGKM
jgi:hypothetical protein